MVSLMYKIKHKILCNVGAFLKDELTKQNKQTNIYILGKYYWPPHNKLKWNPYLRSLRNIRYVVIRQVKNVMPTISVDKG